MDSNAEIARAREKDIIRRLEIVGKAKEFNKAEIIRSKDNLHSQRAAILATQYEAYELEEMQVHMQASQYMDKLPSEQEAIKDQIRDLENVLNHCAKGNFLPLRECFQVDAERERFSDPNFGEILLSLKERIPTHGIPVKRPRPSYLDERFNSIDD